MPCQLPADCLNEIFEYLEKDKTTLHSCLLVNRLWCQVAVRILWMNIWNFQYDSYHNSYYYYNSYRTHVPLAILSILIACLPNESKVLLNTNGIFIPTPTSKPPLFNYASFCKVLSICKINCMVETVLTNQPSVTSQSLHYKKYLISQELLKMFMKQISSLKSLDYDKIPSEFPKFTYFPGAKDCLADLSVLSCNSDICPDFLYQLSQICHNIQTFTLSFEKSTISDGLTNLIPLQNNLKELDLSAYDEGDWMDIIPSLTKHYDTLTRLYLHNYSDNLTLSFVALLSNLREIKFSFIDENYFDDFKELQNITFPKLEILEIPYQCPKAEYLVKFLENNGKNLKELNINSNSKLLKLSIAQFCPNLKKLFVMLKNDELDILKTIFNNCQYLESIEVYCSSYINGKEIFKIVAKYSQKDFYELKISDKNSELFSEDLESFFINWKSRTPKKSLVLIIMKHQLIFNYNDLGTNEENMKVIEKYKELGIIKKFGKGISINDY